MRIGVMALTTALFAAPPLWSQDAPPAFRIVTSDAVSQRVDILTLLRRPDVQNGLRLSLRQRNLLAELLQEPPRISVRVEQRMEGSPAGRGEPAEVRTSVNTSESQVLAVLTDEQKARLEELRLQWRGPLALAEPKVADKVGLRPDARAEIGRIAAEYEKVKSEVMQSLAQVQEAVSPDGTQRSVAVRLDTSELERPLSPLRKRLQRAKKSAEEKILALLQPEERERWDALCGAPFTFRSGLPGLRF